MVEGGQIRCKYYIVIYENKIMKPVETVLRKGGREVEGE
jgi:hypothetical protein